MHNRTLKILIFVLICGVAAVPRTNVPASTLPAEKTETVAVPYKLTVRRAEQTFQVTLTPRKLV